MGVIEGIQVNLGLLKVELQIGLRVVNNNKDQNGNLNKFSTLLLNILQ